MSTNHRISTFEDARTGAYDALGEIQDLLRSEWVADQGPTATQAYALSAARQHIAAAKDALSRAAEGAPAARWPRHPGSAEPERKAS